jgi:RNA polymerase sigma factor (sigma-70 family)
MTRETEAADNRAPTEEEIAAKMGMGVVGLTSASSRAPEDENQAVPEFPASSDLNPDVMTGRRRLSTVLTSAIGTLPDRYQSVVRKYYVDGKTMREIGDELGINESRVSQIHRADLENMGQNLQSVGIHSSAARAAGRTRIPQPRRKRTCRPPRNRIPEPAWGESNGNVAGAAFFRVADAPTGADHWRMQRAFIRSKSVLLTLASRLAPRYYTLV